MEEAVCMGGRDTLFCFNSTGRASSREPLASVRQARRGVSNNCMQPIFDWDVNNYVSGVAAALLALSAALALTAFISKTFHFRLTITCGYVLVMATLMTLILMRATRQNTRSTMYFVDRPSIKVATETKFVTSLVGEDAKAKGARMRAALARLPTWPTVRRSVRGKASMFMNANNDASCQEEIEVHDTDAALSNLSSVVRSKPTVWTAAASWAAEAEDPVNLGQGFPDWAPPDFVVDSLVETVKERNDGNNFHQYTRPAGHPALVRELARRYSQHLGREIDSMNEVAVTVGASQALYLCLQTLIEPGDEVILFEPYFDLYVTQARLAGAKPVFVPLSFVPYDLNNPASAGEWELDIKQFAAALSPRTRAVILNSPHNPTGKLFSHREMQAIAAEVSNRAPSRCVVVSDEVYKYIIHAPPMDCNTSLAPGHTHFAAIDDMWDRTLTVSSAGKTFSVTGWQVGWLVGPKHLVTPVQRLLPYVQFCTSTIAQEALSRVLPRADEPYEGYPSYYAWLAASYARKRDLLSGALSEAGFGVPDPSRTPGGGLFLLARIGPEAGCRVPSGLAGRPSEAAPGGVTGKDWAMCEWLATEHGIIVIPSAPFFKVERKGRPARASEEFVRVAFCKRDETIEEAACRLRSIAYSSK